MNKYFVEFVGTLILVFAVLVSSGNWVVIGATLGVLVLLGGPSSGACYNPAVTIGGMLAKNIPTQDVLPYIVVEILGGIVGYYIYAITSKNPMTNPMNGGKKK